MKVTVVCYGAMRDYLPESAARSAQVEVSDGARVAEVVDRIGAPRELVFAAFLGGAQVSLDQPLVEGSEVVLMPPFSGGAIIKAAVITVSDGVASGVREDTAGPLLTSLLSQHDLDVAPVVVVPDEVDEIEGALRQLIEEGFDVVVTTGGTGFGPRDVTPEASKRVVEREAPGLAELMRSAGLAKTPLAALSRGIAGIAGRSVVLNLPGSPSGARDSIEAVLPLLPHAVSLLAGEKVHDGSDITK